jgi:hypothetical protein
MRRAPSVPKDKRTGLPKKYVAGSRSPSRKAAEIKRTAKAYKEGRPINVKAVSASRAAQAKRKKKRGKSKTAI